MAPSPARLQTARLEPIGKQAYSAMAPLERRLAWPRGLTGAWPCEQTTYAAADARAVRSTSCTTCTPSACPAVARLAAMDSDTSGTLWCARVSWKPTRAQASRISALAECEGSPYTSPGPTGAFPARIALIWRSKMTARTQSREGSTASSASASKDSITASAGLPLGDVAEAWSQLGENATTSGETCVMTWWQPPCHLEARGDDSRMSSQADWVEERAPRTKISIAGLPCGP